MVSRLSNERHYTEAAAALRRYSPEFADTLTTYGRRMGMRMAYVIASKRKQIKEMVRLWELAKQLVKELEKEIPTLAGPELDGAQRAKIWMEEEVQRRADIIEREICEIVGLEI